MAAPLCSLPLRDLAMKCLSYTGLLSWVKDLSIFDGLLTMFEGEEEGAEPLMAELFGAV